MSFYIEYIHIWSANIVFLLFILSAIGHILQDGNNRYLSKNFVKYYNVLLFLLVLTGLIILINNQSWISFPIFRYKLILVIILISISTTYCFFHKKSTQINPIFLILSFLSVYSVSMLIGRYING